MAQPLASPPKFFDYQNSCTRYIHQQGKNTSGSNPTLLFIPGWAGSLEVWKHQLNTVEEYPLIVLDYPGFGDSKLSVASTPSKQDRFTLEFHAEIVNGILKQEAVSDCIVIGHSLGGALGLTAAATNPKTIKAVIGADSLIYNEIYPKIHEEVSQAFVEQFERDFKGSVAALLTQYFVEQSEPNTIEWLNQSMMAADPDVGTNILREFMSWSLDETLEAYAGPVSVIACESGYASSAFAPRFQSRIPVRTIDHAGHFVMLDQAARFNQALGQILSNIIEHLKP